jgi:hypothetical protein
VGLVAYVKRGWANGVAPAINGANLDAMDQGIKDVTDWVLGITGWVDFSSQGVTLAYSSTDGHVNVLTVNTDLRAVLPVGARIQYTQGGTVKYGIVVAVAAGSITVYGGTDYIATNVAISAVSFSIAKVPFGFPADADKWTEVYDSGTQAGITSPTASTWYNVGSFSFSVPIGAWELSYTANFSGYRGAAGPASVYCDLATNGGTGSTVGRFSARIDGDAPSTRVTAPAFREDDIILGAKTPYYFLIMTPNTGLADIFALERVFIRARCAYL